MSMLTRTFVCIAIAGAALGAGCASEGPRPVEQLTRARTLIDAADRGGNAQRYAAADLQRAHDELANANSADSAGRFNEARAHAESAAADAKIPQPDTSRVTLTDQDGNTKSFDIPTADGWNGGAAAKVRGEVMALIGAPKSNVRSVIVAQ